MPWKCQVGLWGSTRNQCLCNRTSFTLESLILCYHFEIDHGGIGSCYFPSTHNQMKQLLLYFQYNQLYVHASNINEEFYEPFCKLSIFRWWKISMPSQTSTGKKILLLCMDGAPAVFGNISEFAILGNKEVQQASLWLIGFYIWIFLSKLHRASKQFFPPLPWQLSVSSETRVWITGFPRGAF